MIKLQGIVKRYGKNTVYNDLNFTFNQNQITAVLGESGSGKTTLLNIIGGLTDFEGQISGDYLPTSFVFQKDRLVKNLSVEENLKLICPEADVERALELVNLKDYAKSYPKQLSAGMARRVSLLRAFLYQSKSLLMDEPFINLDISLKYSLLNLLLKMQEKSPKTVVFVTHDIKEAIFIADRIVVINKGQVIFDKLNQKEKTEKELFDLMMNLGDS